MEELKKEPVTVFLILVNVLVFLVVEFTGGTENTGHMLQCGAAYTPAVINGEFYRLFTSMFLHFGPRHLGNNMLVLFVLGGRIKLYQAVRSIQIILVYITVIIQFGGIYIPVGWIAGIYNFYSIAGIKFPGFVGISRISS